MKNKIFKVVAVSILLAGFFFGVGIGMTALWVNYYNTRICWENPETGVSGCGEYVSSEIAEAHMKNLIRNGKLKNLPMTYHFEQR